VDLIVAHNNADFDAFGSLVAARKLYPNSKLLLPGSQERAVREFLSLAKDKIIIENERTCDLSDIKRLVIVDTRHKSRIGIAGKLLEEKSPEVHIYDHHPRTAYDIKADRDVFQQVGATVSILVDILRKEKKAKFTPLEATIMLLAIYEETGSLTYRTTTGLDVDTVSFLLSRGANLQAVSSYLNRKLTEEELAYLTSLIGSTKVVIVNGVNVAIAEGTVDGFIGELGTIVRKLQDVENFPVLFVLFKIRNKIRVIARSRLKELDVNRVLKHFGGGGHSSAASAKVEEADFAAFEARLINVLKSNIRVRIFAKDIMKSPVKTISSNNTIAKTKKMLDRMRLRGVPVMQGKKIIGIITARDIKKAMKYRYGHASVKGYMSRSIMTVKPKTPLHAIQRIMFENNIGRVPVMQDGRLVGIVTRTDVLKTVHREIFRMHPASLPDRKKQTRFNISAKMKKVLPRQLLVILHTIGRLAKEKGYRAFVVGGFVRDILLGVRNFDMDIVVEGDAIEFGRMLAHFYKGSLVSYTKFGTSTVIIGWPRGLRKPGVSGRSASGRGTDGRKFKIDIATARKESYDKPAALPTVEFSSLKNDLQRRDFTINAMAASVNKETFGQLIDFFGGEKDLESGVIRVLHDGSFIDDPTRIFRAVRFEQRFGFCIDKYTENLIKHAVSEGMFSKTQNQRIRDELMLMLEEADPARAILRMKELHELRFIHPKIKITKSVARLFSRIKEVFNMYAAGALKGKHVDLRLLYLMALFNNLTKEDVSSICSSFVLRRSDCSKLLAWKKCQKKVPKYLSRPGLRPSGIYSILAPLPLEGILFFAAGTKNRIVLSRIDDFISEYRKARIKIGGSDLKQLGIKEGPLYSKILARILHRRIDGKIKTKKNEIDFAKGMARGD